MLKVAKSARGDVEVMEDAIRRFLEASGVDLDDPHLVDTPARVARTYSEELLSGYRTPPEELLRTFEEPTSPVVVVRDISFYSLCAHHLLPFHGNASIGYQPNGRIVGLSKIARLVECLSRRLQVQESLTRDICDTLCQHLKPEGVAVLVRAEHMCMSMRGISRPNTETVTYFSRGLFEEDRDAGARMFELLKQR